MRLLCWNSKGLWENSLYNPEYLLEPLARQPASRLCHLPVLASTLPDTSPAVWGLWFLAPAYCVGIPDNGLQGEG